MKITTDIRQVRSLMVMLALLALAGCNSPLDVPTKRIDTQLTNRIKVRSVTVSAMIRRPADTVTIDDWPHTVTSDLFSADTLGTPPHIRMDYRMQAIPIPAAPAVWLKEVTLHLDDVKAEGTAAMTTGSGPGSRGTATIVVDGREYTTTIADNASGMFYYQAGGRESIEGTIVIGMDRSPAFSLVLAVGMVAE